MEKNIIAYQVKGQVLCYRMPREVDHHVAQRLCRELDMLVDSHQVRELILDFGETEFMDSSGIGVVIGRSKTMGFHSGQLFVVNVGKRVDAIFHSTGLYKIVGKKEEQEWNI